jgi:hypothetical protein
MDIAVSIGATQVAESIHGMDIITFFVAIVIRKSKDLFGVMLIMNWCIIICINVQFIIRRVL